MLPQERTLCANTLGLRPHEKHRAQGALPRDMDQALIQCHNSRHEGFLPYIRMPVR